MDEDTQTLTAFEARIDEVLRRQINAFSRTFMSVIVIGLGLFYFIVLPYISSHTAQSSLSRQAKVLEQEIAFAKRAVAYHDELIGRIDDATTAAYRMREELIDGSYHLKLRDEGTRQHAIVAQWKRELRGESGAAAWIKGDAARPTLSAAFYHSRPALKKPFKDPCFWLDAEPWIFCRIGQELMQQHRKLSRGLGNTNTELSPGFRTNDLRHSLDDQVAPFARWSADPVARSKTEVGNIRQLLSKSLERYRQIVFDTRQVLKESQASLSARQATGESALEQTREKVQHAEAKLAQARKFENLETPIGNLPIGLDGLVLLFPIALILAVCYLGNQLERAIELRHSLHRALAKRAIEMPGGTIRYLQITLSVWLEPFDPLGRRLIQALLLAMPAIAALFAAYLAIDADFLFNEKVVPEITTRMAYLFGYTLSLLLLLFAGWRLVRTIDDYRLWGEAVLADTPSTSGSHRS